MFLPALPKLNNFMRMLEQNLHFFIRQTTTEDQVVLLR